LAETTTDPTWQEPKRRRPRWLWLVGIGAAVAVVAGAAAIGYSQNWGKDSGPGTAAPSSSAPADGGLGGDVVTEDPGSDNGANAVSWKGLKFEHFHGSRVPVSPLYGPKRHSDTQASGFAHNTGGAVMAAVHLGMRASAQAGPDTYGPTVEKQMTGDTTTYLAELDKSYQEARESSGLPDGEPLRIYTQVIGYAPPAADPGGDEATVTLLVRGPNRSGGTIMGDFPVTMEWADGDWKMMAPAGGEWSFNPVSSTDGYELFPGVS
jgi:hypothetical protein